MSPCAEVTPGASVTRLGLCGEGHPAELLEPLEPLSETCALGASPLQGPMPPHVCLPLPGGAGKCWTHWELAVAQKGLQVVVAKVGEEESHGPLQPRFCAFCSSRGHLLESALSHIAFSSESEAEGGLPGYGKSLPLPLGVGVAGVQKCN